MFENQNHPEVPGQKFDLEKCQKKLSEKWNHLSQEVKTAVVLASFVAAVGITSATGFAIIHHNDYEKFDPNMRYQVAPGMEISYGSMKKAEWSKQCLFDLKNDLKGNIEQIKGACKPEDQISVFNTGEDEIIIIQEEFRIRDHEPQFREVYILPGDMYNMISPYYMIDIRQAK